MEMEAEVRELRGPGRSEIRQPAPQTTIRRSECSV